MARRPEFPQIAERLQRDYPSSSPDALPGERDLARRYGVSRPTISKALALLTEQGVLKRRAPGAPPAPLRSSKAPKTTIVSYVGPVSGPFHGPFLLTLLIQGSNRGYHLRVIPVPVGEPLPEDVVPRLAGSHAVIGGVADVQALEQACPRAARLVLVGLASPDPALASRPIRAIHVDLAHGMEAAIRHAASLGRKGPVWVTVEAADIGTDIGPERVQRRLSLGLWLGRMRDPPNQDYLSIKPYDMDDQTRLEAQLAAATPPPTAIVCSSAAVALVARDIVRDLSHTNPTYRSLPIISLGHDPLMQSVAPEIIAFDYGCEAAAHQVLAACFLAPPAKQSTVITIHPALIAITEKSTQS